MPGARCRDPKWKIMMSGRGRSGTAYRSHTVLNPAWLRESCWAEDSPLETLPVDLFPPWKCSRASRLRRTSASLLVVAIRKSYVSRRWVRVRVCEGVWKEWTRTSATPLTVPFPTPNHTFPTVMLSGTFFLWSVILTGQCIRERKFTMRLENIIRVDDIYVRQRKKRGEGSWVQ